MLSVTASEITSLTDHGLNLRLTTLRFKRGFALFSLFRKLFAFCSAPRFQFVQPLLQF